MATRDLSLVKFVYIVDKDFIAIDPFNFRSVCLHRYHGLVIVEPLLNLYHR